MRPHCSGSVLNAVRVLTAASCINQRHAAQDYSIMAGSTLRTGEPTAQYRTLYRYLQHPRFSTVNFTSDVAVLFFLQPLEYGANVRPIRLPAPNANLPNSLAQITGWGVTREGVPDSWSRRLLVVRIPVVTQTACRQVFSDLLANQFCVAHAKGGFSPCSGDEGAPLTMNGLQYGIASYGRGCGRPGVPFVFTRVPVFVNWIRLNLE